MRALSLQVVAPGQGVAEAVGGTPKAWFGSTARVIVMTDTDPHALIERALAEPADSGSRWSYVMSLHRLGDEETFTAAVQLCRSHEPARRTLG